MIWALVGLAGIALLTACGFLAYASNVETPNYTVAESDGAIEIRDYPDMIAAQIVQKGERRQAVSNAFSPLASYIFAKKRPGEKIAMTAPVTQSGDADEWVVRFIMPAQYTRETLPKPAGSAVTLIDISAQRMAAIRFSGVANDALLETHEAQLRQWLQQRGLPSDGVETFAYYNDPFTPGFMRRNEVIIELPAP